jgi:hypothetical protein
MPILSTALLNETIAIQSLSGSDIDDRGNSSASYADSETNVQCKVVRSDKGFTEQDSEGREEINKEFHFLVSKSVTVTEQDRVVYDSKYYNIRNIVNVRDRFGNVFYKKIFADSGY